MTDLSQKTAIVTGGGRGIGRGIVLELARAGANVVLADVDLESSERTAKEIEELGRQTLVTRIDVADARSVRKGVEQALARFGRIEILVNNAGVVQDHVGAAITEDDFDRCYQVNLKGIWHVTCAVVPHVNAVCPGLLWTPMWEKLEGIFRGSTEPGIVAERAAFDAHIRSNCPLQREQTPEDIGHAVVFLVSEQARNITGQALNVDGGIQMN